LFRDHLTEELPDTGVAYDLASRQRDISMADFLLTNRHLFGSDSPAEKR